MDPYAADILAEMRRAAEQHGLNLPDEAVCQAFGLPMARQLVRDCLTRNRDADALIGVFNPLLGMVKGMVSEGFWPDPTALTAFDLTYEWRPVFSRGLVGMPLVGVLNPLENIGRGMAQVFEERWLGKTFGEKPDLSVRLVGPEDIE